MRPTLTLRANETAFFIDLVDIQPVAMKSNLLWFQAASKAANWARIDHMILNLIITTKCALDIDVLVLNQYRCIATSGRSYDSKMKADYTLYIGKWIWYNLTHCVDLAIRLG